MTPGRAALVGLMYRYLGGLMDPFVTLLEVHKLLYFMQEAGKPLRLRYVQGPYGPYAENLSHVLRRIEGHLVSGYADGGDNPEKQLELVPGAVEEADAFPERPRVYPRPVRSGSRSRGRVRDPVRPGAAGDRPLGRPTLGATSPDEVVAKTYAWNDRKRRFSPRQIHLALDVLASKGWLAVA